MNNLRFMMLLVFNFCGFICLDFVNNDVVGNYNIIP